MNQNPLFFLHMMTLLATAAANLIAADPRGFAGKLAERIRLDNGSVTCLPTGWLRRIAAEGNTEARKLIDAGHLTKGIRNVVEQGSAASMSDIHLAKRTVERIKQLEAKPPTAPGGAPKIPGDGPHRVLHVLTNSKPFTNSGYTVRSHHVLKCQQQVGIEVQAVTRLGYPVLVGKVPASPQQTIDGVIYHQLLPWCYPPIAADRHELGVRMIVDLACAMNATILHTTTDYTNALIVAEAARQLNLPWIYEVRGELESTWLARQSKKRQETAEGSEFYRLARHQETQCMNAANAVVVLSEISKQELIERGILTEKITVIPNAVADDEVAKEFNQKAIRRELGLNERAVIVGTVTAVVDYEGLDTLIDALEYFPAEYQVLIVGDGSARLELEAQAKKLGFIDRVHFAGRQPSENIWRWYAALDAFVVPRKDTKVTRTVTPIKPLTAMALGIPVITSDLPALREVTGGYAKYVEPGNSRMLASAVVAVAGKQQGGIEWANSRTWTKNGMKYQRLYDEVHANTLGFYGS